MIRSLRPLLMVLVAALLPQVAFATAQAPDLLLYHGDTLLLQTNPLEKWLEQQPQRPAELRGNGSTACWRGYVATWLLKDDHLFLLAVQPCGGLPLAAAVLQKWFPLEDPHRIAATWVMGRLDVVKGKLVRYEHLGYGSIYEQDWLLTFEAGKLVGQQLFTTRGCEMAEPPGGARTFSQRLSQAVAWARVPAMAPGKPRRMVAIEFQPDSTSRHCRVRLAKSAGAPYDSLAMAAARLLAAANWGTCYRWGRWQPFRWTAPVFFDEATRRRQRGQRRPTR
ncbi:hypothetical protein GCM10022409_43830 [Hymenobacter glaciei]|uniref:TonB C-terminal domain-containing protein n=1 Tax=Hymenobacter glaciei TaxID=877209 RepID=A0ABP7UTH6_9BACT